MEPRISIITLGVSDLDRSIRFYRDGLGFPKREGFDAIAFFECEVREIANDQGDHAVVIGEVVEAGVPKDEPALTLLDTGWHYGG